MQKVDGSVTQIQEDGTRVENMMFTYSEDEKQKNEINANNAELLFLPEFIPYYPHIAKSYNLTDKETLFYGFIRFYLGVNKRKRFYFSNGNLSEMFSCSEKHVSTTLKKLKEVGLIDMSYKIKSGGGQIRFISWVNLDITSGTRPSLPLPTSPSLPTGYDYINKNKIKENKIKHTVVGQKETEVIKEIEIAELYQEYFPMDYVPRDRRNDLIELEEEHGKEHLLKALEAAKKQGKPNTRYIRGILRDQKSTGYMWGKKKERQILSLKDMAEDPNYTWSPQ